MPSRGKSKQRPTVLEALARRVPPHGPKVDWTVIAPWEVPVWAAQTSHWGVTNPVARVEWVQSLVDIGIHSGVEVLFTAAKVMGRDLEGTGELIPVGGVLCYCRNIRPTWVKFNSKDTKESEWCSRF